jgi:hypothetical protein
MAGEASHAVLLPLMKTLRFCLCNSLNELKLQSREIPVGQMPFHITTATGTHQVGHLFFYLFIACPQSLFQVFHFPVCLMEMKTMNCSKPNKG